MARYLTADGIVCGVLLIVTWCWPIPNRMSVSPDGIVALTMPDQTDGLYEAFPRSGHIWLIDALTGRVQTVLAEGDSLSWATFSPDGQELLFVEGPPHDPMRVFRSMPSRPWRLMLFHRQSETYTELIRGEQGFVWGPTFSPDGKKIAYYRDDDAGRLELALFDREAREEHRLKLMRDRDRTFYVPYEPGPLWASDSQGIFVLRVERILPERIAEGQLALWGIECGCEQPPTRDFFPTLPVPFSLIASPDGKKLYFNSYDQTLSLNTQERVNLYEFDLETGEQVALYDRGGIVFAPMLSPGGRRLLFTVIVREETLKADLYLLDFSLAAPARKLTDDGRSGFGFWISPERVGYIRSLEAGVFKGEIWTRDLRTGEERNLSMLLGVQSLAVQLIRESKNYQKELTATRQALAKVEHELQTLAETIAELSHKLDAAQTQSLEIGNRMDQRIEELAKQMAMLMADMSAVKAQISVVESEVKAVSERPVLSLWQLVIALLLTVIVIVWLIRRALQRTAQELAFPPQ